MPKEKGGRGKKGGLSEYAEKVGKDAGALTRYRHAAEVFTDTRETVESTQWFLSKAEHLSAIHSANRPLWPMLVNALLAKGWLFEDAKHHVGQVQEFGKVLAADTAGWREVFLDEVAVVQRFLDTKEFSAKIVAALAARASSVVAAINAAAEAAGDVA